MKHQCGFAAEAVSRVPIPEGYSARKFTHSLGRMEHSELLRLADAYIERYAKRFEWGPDQVLRERELNWWAWEEFERLTHESPDEAWEAILAVVERTGDEYTLEMLGAGPLEDLIQYHGPAVVERIERRAQTDNRFLGVLQCVWRSSTPDVWARIEVAQGEEDAV